MAGSIWTPGGNSGSLTSKLVKEIALSDMTTVLIAATGLGYFRVYAPFRLLALYASVFVVSSAGLPTVDVNVNGSTILSTKLTIDANEKDSTTAATAYVFTGSPAPTSWDFTVGQEVSFDLDVAGANAKGLIVYMLGFDL
jgi:hypothetical protein